MGDTMADIAAKLEAAIRSAILHHTGQDDVILADVARLGVRKVMPDGTEIFAWNGVDLVQFWPVEVNHGEGADCHKITATRKYRLLRMEPRG